MRYLVRDRIVIASVVQIALALMTGKAWAQSPPVYNPEVASYVITDLGVLPGVVHNPQTRVDLRDNASEAYAISASGAEGGTIRSSST